MQVVQIKSVACERITTDRAAMNEHIRFEDGEWFCVVKTIHGEEWRRCSLLYAVKLEAAYQELKRTLSGDEIS